MLLNAISLSNYRSFVDKTEFELRPLTLIFGQNSAGKSALVRALPLIAASMAGKPNQPLALESPANRNARFQDILSAAPLQSEPLLRMGLQFVDEREAAKILTLEWAIRELPERRRLLIDSFLATFENFRLSASLTLTENLATFGKQYDVKWGAEPLTTRDFPFDGLLPLPEAVFATGPDGRARTPLGIQLIHARRLHQATQWLTSVRVQPARINLYKGFLPKQVAQNGVGTADVLAYDELFGGNVLPTVSAWFEKYINRTLRIQQASDYYSVMLQAATDSPFQVNFADAGEGLIQVLPVLVASTLACENANPSMGSLLAVEEPECHLHPNLHAPLAEHFCALAKRNTSVRFLVETHSENFLLRTQIAVAKREIDPSQVIVYWVRQSEVGRSSISRVEFDEKGHPRGDWPKNVFKDDRENAKTLLQLQLGGANDASLPS